jgi:hypothetical protein
MISTRLGDIGDATDGDCVRLSSRQQEYSHGLNGRSALPVAGWLLRDRTAGGQLAMPLGYDIYPDIALLFIRGQGMITQREWIHTMVAWLDDPQYEHCRDAFVDLAGVESTPKVGDLRELIAIFTQHMPARGPGRVAVVTSSAITFALARVFEGLVRVQDIPLEFGVFMNLEQAWTWLRPGEPPFQPH